MLAVLTVNLFRAAARTPTGIVREMAARVRSAIAADLLFEKKRQPVVVEVKTGTSLKRYVGTGRRAGIYLHRSRRNFLRNFLCDAHRRW